MKHSNFEIADTICRLAGYVPDDNMLSACTQSLCYLERESSKECDNILWYILHDLAAMWGDEG